MTFVAFDVETSGTEREYALQPFRALTSEAWLTCSAFVYPTGVETPWIPHSGNLNVEDLRAHLKFIAENRYTIAAWNAPFDAAWLIALGLRDEVFACKWVDTMLLWKHTRQQPTFTADKNGYGLKKAVEQYFSGEAGYEEDIDFHATDKESLEKLAKYNRQDAMFTLKLTNRFWSELTGRRRFVQVEAQCIPLVADTLVSGVPIDTEAAETLSQSLKERAQTAYAHLVLTNPEITRELLASPTQLRELLYEKWHLHKTKFTDTGNASTDREALTELARADERAALINEYRENTSNRTKFAEGAIKSAEYNGDGNARPQFRIYGTYTGRGTYSANQGRGKDARPTGIAIHQWKRDRDFRSIIQAPPGYKLVEFDFAGQEFRWMAVVSGDPTMLELCEPGRDAHRFMASRIYNKQELQITKDERQLGKVANLSLQYRTGAGRLATLAKTNYGLDLELGRARSVHATYQTTYRDVPKYWKRQMLWIDQYEYVQNMVGRRVHIPFSERRDREWQVTSTAINFPIQSMGADQKYAALMLLRTMLPKYNGRLLFELHDGVYMLIPETKAEKALHQIGNALNNLDYGKIFRISLPTKFPVDAKMGDNWGDLQEIEIDGS